MNSTISIGSSAKITREHLQRLAVVYVRQSTLAQVRDHGESTARQYALTNDAERLGWPADQVVVIDADLGVSGRGGSARTGFKEFLIIPPLVSIWGTGKRMQLTQRAADVYGGSGLLWFVLHVVPVVSLFAPVYLQYQLNKAWETRPELVELGTTELATAGA